MGNPLACCGRIPAVHARKDTVRDIVKCPRENPDFGQTIQFREEEATFPACGCLLRCGVRALRTKKLKAAGEVEKGEMIFFTLGCPDFRAHFWRFLQFKKGRPAFSRSHI